MAENKIEVFTSPEFGQVRTLTIDGEPYFVGKDVAEALGYTNTKKAIGDHVDEEDKRMIQRSHFVTLENNLPKEAFPVNFVDANIPNRGLTVINESGVYALVFGSKLPNAKKFKRWVTSEVLPSIRKTGSYNSPDYSSLSPQLQYLISLEQKTKELETAVQTTNRRLDSMCETMQIKGDNWRKATHSLINRIATASGQEQRAIYLDIYDELEYRAGCNLSIRFDNLSSRLFARGVSQSRINRLNYIDVIADDKRLTEIYIAIVKEMAVKFNVC